MISRQERDVNALAFPICDDEFLIPFALDANGTPIVYPEYETWLNDHEPAKINRRIERRSFQDHKCDKFATKKFVRRLIRRELQSEITAIVEFVRGAANE